MEELGSALLALYSAAQDVDWTQFQDTALTVIMPVVAFTAAAWGTGRLLWNGAADLCAHLLGNPPECLNNHEMLKERSVAALAVGLHSRHEFHFNTSNADEDYGRTKFRQNVERWEDSNCLLTGCIYRGSGRLDWIGVYRAGTDAPYADRERKLLAHLLTHLNEALRINRIVNMGIGGSSLRGGAILDRFGALCHAGGHFWTLIQREWPQSTDRELPNALRDHFARQPTRPFVGSTLIVGARHIRDLMLLNARERTLIDDMTPKELAIAQLIADGLRHKDIAKRLGLAPTTVRNYTQKIHQRLGVRTNVELARLLMTT